MLAPGRHQMKFIGRVIARVPVTIPAIVRGKQSPICVPGDVIGISEATGVGFNNTPIWTDSLNGECGTCHAYVHVGTLSEVHSFHVFTVGLICNDCHASVIDSNLVMIEPSLHVNGQAVVTDAVEKNGGHRSLIH